MELKNLFSFFSDLLRKILAGQMMLGEHEDGILRGTHSSTDGIFTNAIIRECI